MEPQLGLAIGCALALAGWLIVRAEAGASFRALGSLALDALIPAAGFGSIAILTQRPIFSGGVAFALCAGVAFADYCKRKAFGEPVLLADFYSTIDILKHPEICLIFPRPLLLVSLVSLTIGVIAGLFALEPPTLRTPVWAAPAFLATAALVIWLLARPLRHLVAHPLGKLNLTAQPRHDAHRVGLFAMLLTHTLLARAERPRLQSAVKPQAPTSQTTPAAGGPILLVQSESFFDPRRLHDGVAADILTAYDRCRAEAVQWGAFGVPAWGANTERTEFSVLTGLPPKAAGFDRFNPYRRFARAPIASLAWSLRSQGYRTICVHPFDRTFYGRDKVFSQLGFEIFIGEEAFADADRRGTYVSDADVALRMVELLKQYGPKTFIFAITMENHAPWGATSRFEHDFAPGLPPMKDRVALGNYLGGIASADAMIKILTDELRARADDGMLGFYGDHLPNLTGVFSSLGFRSRRTDYFLWRAGGGGSVKKDLAAHNLAGDLWLAHQKIVRFPAHTPSEPIDAPFVNKQPAVYTRFVAE